nr:methyl-accepting chemotaxis protein [uncultured Carboxylicivirga sp.]
MKTFISKLFFSFVEKWLLRLSIGVRLKLVISLMVSVIIIILGIILYNYQKEIIFDQAKQNSYATIDDLIRFTQNEIDASRDKVGYFGQATINYFQSLGSFSTDHSRQVQYRTHLADAHSDTLISVPSIFYGKTRVQGDTICYSDLQKIGVEYLLYYQKTDDYFVEVLNSHNQFALKNNETAVFPLNYEGLWRLNAVQDSISTCSHWTGNKWVQTIRLYTKDDKGEINGAFVVGIQERDEIKLSRTFLDKTFYKTGICYQISDNKDITFHPNLPNFFRSDNQVITQIVSEKMIQVPSYSLMTDSTGVRKYMFYKYYPANYNNVVVEIPESEIFTSLYALRNGIAIAILALIASIYLLITYIARTITNRLDKAVTHARKISNGDLTSTIAIDSKDELAELGSSLNQMSSVLKSTVTEITSTIEVVNNTNSELSLISKNIAHGANEQAASLEEISSSMEEMNSTVQQNAHNAQKTSTISDESAKNIQNSSDVLQESVTYLNNIVEKVSVINDISFQTNILALNAAVEAARAGEYGRGFSVVAGEVRRLAERSREAAEEIGLVSDKGKDVAHQAGSKLADHLPMVYQIADLVKEISASSTEQNSGIEQINAAIQGLNQIAQQNTNDANTILDSIDHLSDNSQKLTDAIHFFKTEED